MPSSKPKRLADLTPETWYYVRCRYTDAGMFLPHGCGGPILYLTDSDIPNCVYPIPSNQTETMPTEPLVNSQSSLVNILVSLDPGATLPTRAHPSDIGYDVTALTVSDYPEDPVEHCLKQAMAFAATNLTQYLPKKILIDTGVHVRPAPGYYCELVPNSRLAKTPFSYGNSIGIIDPNYTGSIKVLLNVGESCTRADLEYLKRGTVVGQLIIRPQLHANFTQVPHLPKTDRGTGGFGSTANH